MTTPTLRDRLAAAQHALDERDLEFLAAAVSALDAARDAVRRAALDLPLPTWRPATYWNSDGRDP